MFFNGCTGSSHSTTPFTAGTKLQWRKGRVLAIDDLHERNKMSYTLQIWLSFCDSLNNKVNLLLQYRSLKGSLNLNIEWWCYFFLQRLLSGKIRLRIQDYKTQNKSKSTYSYKIVKAQTLTPSKQTENVTSDLGG